MQCKDIPTEPILDFIGRAGRFCTLFEGTEMPCVRDAMPPGTPEKVAYAKMRSLIRKGLVDGCVCGCRGDFELTARGHNAIQREPEEITVPTFGY